MDELAQTIRRQRSQVEQEIVALSAETDPTTLRYKLVRPPGLCLAVQRQPCPCTRSTEG